MIIFCYYHASYSLLNVLYVCCPIVGIITCIFYFRAPFIKYITTTDWVVYPFSTPVSYLNENFREVRNIYEKYLRIKFMRLYLLSGVS